MRKLVFFLIISLIGINSVFATVTNYGDGVGANVKDCNENSVTPSDNSNGTKFVFSDTETNSATTTGNFNCTSHNYYTSGNFTVTGTYGGTKGNNFITHCPSETFPVSFTRAGTAITIICKPIDDTPPDITDIVLVSPSYSELLANTNHVIYSSIARNGGAPIVSMSGSFEDEVTVNLQIPFNISPATSSSVCLAGSDICDDFQENFNYRYIDNDRTSSGSREYSYEITDICDEATNCVTLSDVTNYNVYANTSLGNISSRNLNNFQAIALNSAANIADGDTDFHFDITLDDIYGNEIVPATGINRTIDFHFDKNNSLYLNQYNRTGSSSVLVRTPNSVGTFSSFPIGSAATTFPDQSSNDGVYPFGFKVYTPTSNSYTSGDPVSDIDAEFLISSIDIDISGTGGLGARSGVSILNSNNIDFRFSPLFTTTISGDLINDGTFLEGSNQISSINFAKDLGSPVSLSPEVYLEFSSGATNTESTKVGLSLSGSQNSGFVSLLGGNPSGGVYLLLNRLSNFIGNHKIETILNLASGATYDNISNSHFSTHIRYILDGYDISYNGDIFGKDSYWDGASGTGATLGGVKVLGLSTSTQEKSHELITGQDEDSLHLLGDFIKANLKQDVRRNAYILTKNIDIDNGLYRINDLTGNIWNNSNGKIIYDDSILYFSGTGNLVELSDGTGALVEGNKTIILEGLDLYINSNMYYGDKEKNILGIIVLKNKFGNGGNVYINPDVTNIVGNIYADKSVISADNSIGTITNKIESSEELGGGLHQSVLKNQLHIYGSVFSENTLGGSRANPITCPYYITSGDCINGTDLEKMNEAQKYDLNYLRRYTLNGSDIPLNNGKVIGAGTCSTSLNCSGESKYARYLTGTVDEYASYPVIIEYNPIIQYSPPPLFSK